MFPSHYISLKSKLYLPVRFPVLNAAHKHFHVKIVTRMCALVNTLARMPAVNAVIQDGGTGLTGLGSVALDQYGTRMLAAGKARITALSAASSGS